MNVPFSDSPDVSAFANRLRKNLAYRRKWARKRGISCFRVYDRDVPQFPFAIDWFETVGPRSEAHLHVQEIDTGWRMSDEDYKAWLAAVCDAACAVCAVPAAQLHLKRRERQRGVAQYEKADAAAAEVFLVEEAGNRFEINLDSYLDTGLFLDHRPMRGRVAETIAPRAKAGDRHALPEPLRVYRQLYGLRREGRREPFVNDRPFQHLSGVDGAQFRAKWHGFEPARAGARRRACMACRCRCSRGAL